MYDNVTMFSEEIRTLLVQVITSWQVIAVTVVLILYISLLNYATNNGHNAGRSFGAKRKKKSSKAKLAAAPEVVSDDSGLGLEEGTQQNE
ncbi:MAG: hypothetical protein FWD91_00345 [Treponema sp.]|nr:hypothetical protein [Treponema sp.]